MGDTLPRFKAAAVQAAPVWLDRERTVGKACELIREAARNGAELIALPEVFIPAYPYWAWIDHAFAGYEFFKRLHLNSVKVPSEDTERLCRTAREADVHVVVGVNEIDPVRFGTIYNTNLFIDRRGCLMGKHRKLVATFSEKIVWGRGDGSTLRVYDTDIGRLGGLNCGENTNTLARFALLAQGEQVHVANYPAVPYKAGDGYDMESAIQIRSCAHAFEGKVFVVTSCGALSKEIIDDVVRTEEQEALMAGKGNALSGIYDPNGRCIGGPLLDDEGIVYADIDLSEALPLKLMHDITGSYNRFDVFSLHLNRAPNDPLVITGARKAETLEREAGEEEAPSFLPDALRQELRSLIREELNRLHPEAVGET